MKIAVMGSGYVGTTTAVVLTSLEHQVIGADIDKTKVEKLKQGILPFVEPGLDQLLADMLNTGRLDFSTDLAQSIQASDVLFISVGTPPRVDGTADLQYLQAVADAIAKSINGYKVLVTKSTVPVGTNRWLHTYLAEKIGSADKFDVISNPEFLREGAALYDTLHPDRTVIGGRSEHAIQVVQEIYRELDSQFVITDWETAELIKYASNSFLAAKISFINEIARIADRVGADIQKVARGMGLDPRIGKANLQAGIGYGGSCFPKDVKALIATAQELGVQSNILEAVQQTNLTQPYLYLQKLTAFLQKNRPQPWKIAVLGLTFKPDTDDQRESPAIPIINQLLSDSEQIRIIDPTVEKRAQTPWPSEPKIRIVDQAEAAVADADAAILCTDWEMFAKINWNETAKHMRTPVLVDGRNLYDPATIKQAGMRYLALGRGDT